MLNAIKPKTRTVVLYLMVPVAMFIFTVFVPLITAFVYSFFEWKGGPQKTFIGIENYTKLFADGTFWEAFGHNIYLVIACIIGQIGIAFVLVMMVNSKLVHCKTIHRTFGFFPSTISAVCIGLIWNRSAGSVLSCMRRRRFRNRCCRSGFRSGNSGDRRPT